MNDLEKLRDKILANNDDTAIIDCYLEYIFNNDSARDKAFNEWLTDIDFLSWCNFGYEEDVEKIKNN